MKTSRAGQIIIKEGKRKENQTNTTQERKLTIKVKQGHEVLIYTFIYTLNLCRVCMVVYPSVQHHHHPKNSWQKVSLFELIWTMMTEVAENM